jgi:hypothetical protein
MLSYLGRPWSTDYLLKALFSSPHQVKRKLFIVHADISNQALFCFLTTAGFTRHAIGRNDARPSCYWLKMKRHAIG